MKEQSLFEVYTVVESILSEDSIYDLPQVRLRLLVFRRLLVSAVSNSPF
jgi:hypothetical protein